MIVIFISLKLLSSKSAAACKITVASATNTTGDFRLSSVMLSSNVRIGVFRVPPGLVTLLLPEE